MGELCTEGHTKTPASSRMQKQQRKFGMGVDWFVSPNNFEVIVGRSAASNERVSFELAPKNGLWFHAACPGAHVAFMCAETSVKKEDIEFAAAIAGWHSKARGEALVTVNYCSTKNVWKVPFSPLGKVMIIGQCKSIQVTPKLPKHVDGTT